LSNIILIGFMGAGKSAVGRRVAERAGARFLDTDKEIEREVGMPVAQLFSERGEAAFREIETQLLHDLVQHEMSDHDHRRNMHAVLSTGGGLPLRPENQELLRSLGHIIWLRATPETISGRVAHKIAQRPIIADHGHRLVERIEELQAERYPRYTLIADTIIDTDNCASPDQAAARVFDHWKKIVSAPTRHHDGNQHS
jgi:shikimate kinase